MIVSPPPTEAAGPWAPYAPTKEAPWDLRRVVHLHRRAGFAATWPEIQRDLKDGPRASIDRVLAARAPSDGFETLAARLADTAVADDNAGRLKAWWVYRMLLGADALGERLTLLWHNHFATSNLKVRDLAAMHRQNETFRELARAPFGKLLHRALRDPALLVWLDAPANRKGRPNENLARELMELFTLGIGHYGEADVKEAARTLTGWTVAGDTFRQDDARHDDGPKVVLGKKGKLTGADLLDLLLEHPATSERLAWRLCEHFLGEGVDPAARKALAEGLRRRRLDVGWAVETMLRSRAFFAETSLCSHVLEPAAYVVGSVRALEIVPPPSTVALADWVGRLGQDLFYPPSVFGWAGGRGWITPRSSVRRTSFATALVEGTDGRPLDALGLARRHGRGRDLDDLVGFYLELLLGTAPTPAWRERLLSGLGPRPALDADTARRAVVFILSSPEAHVL